MPLDLGVCLDETQKQFDTRQWSDTCRFLWVATLSISHSRDLFFNKPLSYLKWSSLSLLTKSNTLYTSTTPTAIGLTKQFFCRAVLLHNVLDLSQAVSNLLFMSDKNIRCNIIFQKSFESTNRFKSS